jgi:phosphate:Na+ symporter
MSAAYAPSFFKIVFDLLAGIVLFLGGMRFLASGLRTVAGKRMRDLLTRSTKTVFRAILIGAVATIALESSSFTIILVIALIDAGLLSFARSTGIILGANLGTTIGTQVIAYPFVWYAPLALIASGILLIRGGRSDNAKYVGVSLFGAGTVFYGLAVVRDSVAPLRDYKPLISLLAEMDDPIVGALAGGFVTLVIQSSSAMMGIVLALASQGLITLPAAIAVMFGAEIGTCSDTLLASLGRSREALRAGVFHLLFNIVTVMAGLMLISPFIGLVQWLSASAPLVRQIANAQLLFNLLGMLLFIGFLPSLTRALTRLIPDKLDAM